MLSHWSDIQDCNWFSSTNTMRKSTLKVDFSLVLLCIKALRWVSQAFILASLANTLENQAFSLLYSSSCGHGIFYQNCSELLWEKFVLLIKKKFEFANFLRSLEQFIWTVKGQNNFWYQYAFPTCSWRFLIPK